MLLNDQEKAPPPKFFFPLAYDACRGQNAFSLRAAQFLAQSDYKVLVVDLDFTGKRIQNFLDIQPDTTLGDALLGTLGQYMKLNSMAVNYEPGGFYVLCGGKYNLSVAQRQQVLTTLTQKLSEISSLFDVIFLVSPVNYRMFPVEFFFRRAVGLFMLLSPIEEENSQLYEFLLDLEHKKNVLHLRNNLQTWVGISKRERMKKAEMAYRMRIFQDTCQMYIGQRPSFCGFMAPSVNLLEESPENFFSKAEQSSEFSHDLKEMIFRIFPKKPPVIDASLFDQPISIQRPSAKVKNAYLGDRDTPFFEQMEQQRKEKRNRFTRWRLGLWGAKPKNDVDLEGMGDMMGEDMGNMETEASAQPFLSPGASQEEILSLGTEEISLQAKGYFQNNAEDLANFLEEDI